METAHGLEMPSAVPFAQIPRLLGGGGTNRSKQVEQRRHPAIYIHLWAKLLVTRGIEKKYLPTRMVVHSPHK